MKVFGYLEFKELKLDRFMADATFFFDIGYGLSVIRGEDITETGEYETNLMKWDGTGIPVDGTAYHRCREEPLGSMPQCCRSCDAVTELMLNAQNLPPKKGL